MPVAVVSSATKRFELKSLPGGYVVLRRMTFGQKLERAENSTRQLIHQDSKNGNRAQRRGNQPQDDMSIDLKILQRVVSEYEFKHCVVEHNLTHENNQPLNFQDPTTLDVLDPRVGDEISSYIEEMNNFDVIEAKEVESGKDLSQIESPTQS